MYDDLDKGIIDICHYEYEAFLNKANVVGVGYGYKYIKNIQTNEKVLQVFVEKKVPLNCLCKNDQIPRFYKNIQTDVIKTGPCRMTSLINRVRPVVGGYDIGPAGVRSAGTYGGLVTDGKDYYVLSNNHVLALDNLVPLGNPILQPSTIYGGTSPKDRIGELSKFVPITFIVETHKPINYVDCAIAKVYDLKLVSTNIKYIGIPKGIKLPELSMNVKMTGEKSEFLCGTITSLNVTVEINTSTEEKALFEDQVFFTPPCKSGDSGALVFDKDNYVVGLNFASNAKYSIANTIENVLGALQVELVTE